MSHRAAILALSLTTLLASGCRDTMAAPQVSWRALQPGTELAILTPEAKDSGPLHVVRVDARRAKVGVALASEAKVPARTAGEWCRKAGLAVAINAGMFQTDQRSNVGYLRHGQHLNNKLWNSYRSVLAVHPKKDALPAVL